MKTKPCKQQNRYAKPRVKRSPFLGFFILILLFLIILTFLLINKPSLVMNLRHRIFKSSAETYSLSRAFPLPDPYSDTDGWYRVSADELTSGSRPEFKSFHTLPLLNTGNSWPTDAQVSLEQVGNPPIEINGLMKESYLSLRESVLQEWGETLYVRIAYLKDPDFASLAAENIPVCAFGCLDEHQSGLSLDVYFFEHEYEAFIGFPASVWLGENAHRYGFIQRYPEGKEDRTNVRAVPWHYRFVGLPHAEIMFNNNLTLEEYLDALQGSSYFYYGDIWISRQKGDMYLLPENADELYYSSDNTGGVVLWGRIPGEAQLD